MFDDVIPEGIASMDLATEAATFLLLTRSGRMQLMEQSGQILQSDRNFTGGSDVAWAQAGNYGICIINENKLACFNAQLKIIWDVQITGRITAIAMSPHGGHLAFSTDSGRTHIVTVDKREIAKIDTHRPMDHLAFLAESPVLIAAAEFGTLSAFTLKGQELWSENVMTNIGDVSASGCGKRILLSAFNHGIQVYNQSGKSRGAFMLDGIPSRVSAAQTKTRIAAMTLENRLYWLNFDGLVQWVADLSLDPPQHIRIGPLGDRLFLATRTGRLLHLYWGSDQWE